MELPTVAFVEAFVQAYPDVNGYPTPHELIQTPAVVLRPDAPWIAREGYADHERYVAVCVVSAGDTVSGTASLHDMIHGVAATADALANAGWSFTDAGRAVVDESTGTPFLAAAVRLSFRSCSEE